MAGRANVKGFVIGLAGIAAMIGAGATLARTDLLLSRGFGDALDAARPGLSLGPAPSADKTQGAAVGDEGYWLTRAEAESPTPFAKPLAIGDRISITGRDGLERQLEVVDLKAIGGNLGRQGQSAHPRLMLVTCRVAGAAGHEAPVRFIVEAEPATSPAAAPAKAL